MSPSRPPKKTRMGKRVVSICLEPEEWKQFRMLALDAGVSEQDLGRRAIV